MSKERLVLLFWNTWRISRAPVRKACRTAAAFGFISTSSALVYAASAKSKQFAHPSQNVNVYKDSLVRRRFLSYASISYNDEPYMTGGDFVAAVIDPNYINDDPRMLENISDEKYQECLKNCRTLKLKDVNFLRNLGDKYLISYTEFLFLLSILVKPVDQFSKHFKILDFKNTNTLCKEEFLSIEKLSSGGHIDSSKANVTSMQMFFFGPNQRDEVNYEKFSSFLRAIQRQCLFAEFEKYSEGDDFITDDEFVRLLLRRTYISEIRKARYIDRLESRPEERRKRLSFDQFCQFMNLLNDFPDFEVAIRMFAITKKPLTRQDFQRAVRASTGDTFDSNLVDVIFDVFDEDNDDRLGQKEFLEIMRDSIKSRSTTSYHLHRQGATSGWDAYRVCIKNHMYKSYAS